MNRTQAYWICQLGGWGLYGLLTAAVFSLQVGWETSLITNTASAMLVGIGVTHAFRAFVHRASWTDLALRNLVPRIIGACLVLALLFIGLNDLLVWAGLRTPIGFEEPGYWSIQRLAFSLFGSVIILFPWLAIYFGVHSFWNYRQAEIDKWKLEAQAETAT